MGGGGDNEVKETPEQKELAKIAVEKWNTYVDKYVPMENEFMRRVDDMNSEWQSNRVAGDANKSFNEAFSNAREVSEDNLFEAGINPNSGKFNAAAAGLEEEHAAKGGEGMTAALVEQKDNYTTGIGNLVKLGQGQSTDAQRGLSDVANNSARNAEASARNEFNEQSSNRQMIGTAGGIAARYGLEQVEDKA
jgi:hypothetical protein